MKKSILFIALIIGFTSVSFANDKTKEEKAEEPKRELTAEEKALEQRLTQEVEVTVDELLNSAETKIERVVVYNVAGEIVQIQESNIDLDHLPEGASSLMIENGTQYFILF